MKETRAPRLRKAEVMLAIKHVGVLGGLYVCVLNIGEGNWRWAAISIVVSVVFSYVSIRDYRYEVGVRQDNDEHSGG